MTTENLALWTPRRGAAFTPIPHATAGEVVVRVRAVAVNPVDAMSSLASRLVLPWLRYPAVLGYDVAGDIVEVGPAVDGHTVPRLAPGDRVVGFAVGVEKSRNSAAEGAFQHYVVLMQHLVSPIPDSLSYAQASVLPLTLSTAATGLFQKDHLGLALPVANAPDRHETVLVWGASTSLGTNAVQLAHNAGYRVVATASPRNADFVRSLGAQVVVDRNSATVVDELIVAIGASPLAGTIAIGSGSVTPTMKVAARTTGSRRVASAMPGPLTSIPALLTRAPGVHVSQIWGASLKDNEVGPAIFVDFLPGALASGSYRAEPPAVIVGEGLAAIPSAIERLKAGVSASKLVVTLES
jgi:NADPH:quinone reductase-like Zn-dependent oxidoreductase